MCLTIGSSDRGAAASVGQERVDDWDKSASLDVGATPRRSTSSLDDRGIKRGTGREVFHWQTLLAQLPADLAVPNSVPRYLGYAGVFHALDAVFLSDRLSTHGALRLSRTSGVAAWWGILRADVFLVCNRAIPNLVLDDFRHIWAGVFDRRISPLG